MKQYVLLQELADIVQPEIPKARAATVDFSGHSRPCLCDVQIGSFEFGFEANELLIIGVNTRRRFYFHNFPKIPFGSIRR